MDNDTERHGDGGDWRLPHLRTMMAAIGAEVRPLLMKRSGSEITSLLSSMIGSLACSVGATWGAHGLTDEQHARVLNGLRESLTNGYLAGATESDDFEIVFKERGRAGMSTFRAAVALFKALRDRDPARGDDVTAGPDQRPRVLFLDATSDPIDCPVCGGPGTVCSPCDCETRGRGML